MSLSYKSTISTKFNSLSDVQMIKSALEVDNELQPHRITKTYDIVNNNNDNCYILNITFHATDLKVLRVSMSGTFDMLIVATKTLAEFSTPT